VTTVSRLLVARLNDRPCGYLGRDIHRRGSRTRFTHSHSDQARFELGDDSEWNGPSQGPGTRGREEAQAHPATGCAPRGATPTWRPHDQRDCVGKTVNSTRPIRSLRGQPLCFERAV
jgi:hypothetical protein